MAADSPDPELEARIAALEESMRALQHEVRQTTDDGSFGFPRPPSPNEILRFTDQAVIPAIIALLEVNIKLLQSIRRGIQLTQKRDSVTRDRDQLQAINKDVVKQFERAIEELQHVVEGTPIDHTAKDVLADARALRSELERRTEAARDAVDTPSKETADESGLDTIDVDAELDSIKAEFDTDTTPVDNESDDEENGNGS